MIIHADLNHPEIWRNTDPRDICSYGDYTIIIVRPNPNPGFPFTGFGIIDTKRSWYIRTSFSDHPYLDVDAKWDAAWWWILAPKCP